MRLPIAEPCPEVSNLHGEGSQLHCARCEQTVVDLSVMTAREARSFLGGLVGRPKPCIRYRMDAAGDIVFRSERRVPIGRWSAAVAAGAVAALVPQGAHARHAEPAPPAEITATRDYEGPAEVVAPEDDASGEQTCPIPTEEGILHGGVPPADDHHYVGSRREHRRWLRQERRRERRERRARRRAAPR